MNTQHWTAENTPDLTGKIAVITGGNGGLGFEASRVLAAHGAQVIIACRSAAKGSQAAAAIRREFPRAMVQVIALDLADFNSIHQFAETYLRSFSRIDILINNAGLMHIPQSQTADGFEMQFGVNYLGHFALTGLLLPILLQTEHPRVVTVSSLLHKRGHLHLDDLNLSKGYSPFAAYNQSKLANLLFAFELQRRFVALNTNAISVAAHPGYSATNLALVGPQMQKSLVKQWVMQLGNRILAQPAAQGALPEIYAAVAPDVQGGEFYGPDGFNELSGYPTRVTAAPEAYNSDLAAKLWELSEQFTGVKY